MAPLGAPWSGDAVAKVIDVPTWCDMWLPEYPYAADNYGRGIYRADWKTALRKRHIQANAPRLRNLIVADIDSGDALFDALAPGIKGLRPNLVVQNPDSGTGHAVWALKAPFPTTEFSRRAPVAYAANITEGLRQLVGGDPGYNGFMMKNPVHPDWVAHHITDHQYLFDELAGHLKEAGFTVGKSWDPQQQMDTSGLGRNCTLFDQLRVYGYRQARHCWGDQETLGERLVNHAVSLNGDFPDPLPRREVEAIADSITRWIARNMWNKGREKFDADFRKIQAARGAKSGKKRQQQAQGRQQQILALSAQGMSRSQIVAELGCSESTVKRALRAAR